MMNYQISISNNQSPPHTTPTPFPPNFHNGEVSIFEEHFL